ncbi:MAG: hypothetical protein QW286_01440 [Candidatus Aenigmatarchaeota archaeon]
MNVDWAVAISVFLVFIGIGFSYYWGLFEEKAETTKMSLETVSNKVIDFLVVESWTTPVRYNSSDSGVHTIYFDFYWPEGTKNSTKILDDGLGLSCMVQGNRVYFQASVDEGDNYFEMRFANVSTPLLCNSMLETQGANISMPMASEKSLRISQSMVVQMLATPYQEFRDSLGILGNFRVQVGEVSYGPEPPYYANTYVKEKSFLVQETGQPETIRVMVW